MSCKLSGLAAQAGTSEWMPAQFEPFLDHALEAFGPERCLFGSDWPASSVQTDYLRWWEFVETWAGALATHEAESVMWRSAADVYRLRGFHSDRAPL